MNNYGCFASPFPLLFSISARMSQPVAGAQEPDATVDDDPYYTEGAYYYVQDADDDQY